MSEARLVAKLYCVVNYRMTIKCLTRRQGYKNVLFLDYNVVKAPFLCSR